MQYQNVPSLILIDSRTTINFYVTVTLSLLLLLGIIQDSQAPDFKSKVRDSKQFQMDKKKEALTIRINNLQKKDMVPKDIYYYNVF